MTETPTYVQVLKDMADLLNAISGELTNEKFQKQASMVQERVRTLLSQIKDPVTFGMEEDTIPRDATVVRKKSAENTQSPQTNPTSGKNSPFAEVEGKPVAGIPLSYVNSLEQKKGHRRRQSMPFVNQNASQDDEEEEEEVSDIE